MPRLCLAGLAAWTGLGWSLFLVFVSAHLKTFSELLILLPELNGCANNFLLCAIDMRNSNHKQQEKVIGKERKK